VRQPRFESACRLYQMRRGYAKLSASQEGVKRVESNRQRTLILGSSLVLVAVALLLLPQLFFEPLGLPVRILIQALVVLGLLGSVRGSKPLRVAGWMGMGFFFLYAAFGSLPSVDHPDLDSSGVQRPEHWIWRPALDTAARLRVSDQAGRVVRSELPAGTDLHARLRTAHENDAR